MRVELHQLKTQLSELLERVRLGEEVIILDAGTPIAKLVAVEAPRPHRVLGSARGDFRVPEDFNDPIPDEVLGEFYK